MSVVTMGLVTTAFCLWAEACALQNVDASVVPWPQIVCKDACLMEGEASRSRLPQLCVFWDSDL